MGTMPTARPGGLRKYLVDEAHVTIPEGVTEIGSSAFRGCEVLAWVDIPNSVTEIGEWAFLDCKSLASVSIPGSVAKIGNGAFSGCKGLTVKCSRYSYVWSYCRDNGIRAEPSQPGFFARLFGKRRAGIGADGRFRCPKPQSL